MARIKVTVTEAASAPRSQKSTDKYQSPAPEGLLEVPDPSSFRPGHRDPQSPWQAPRREPIQKVHDFGSPTGDGFGPRPSPASASFTADSCAAPDPTKRQAGIPISIQGGKPNGFTKRR